MAYQSYTDTMTTNRHNIIVNACRALESAESPLSLSELAEAVGLSPAHFQKLFKSQLGVTPKQYANALQRQRAHECVQGEERIIDAAFASGFESVARFYARASTMLGMTPSTFKAGGYGIELDYAMVASSMGILLVAASEVGVCLVEFGNSESELLDLLENRFPAATKTHGRESFEHTIHVVANLVAAKDPEVSVPLDIQGTAFQQRVWQALTLVPQGKTISYQELATRIGHPKSHRAVANACGANPVALIIPCHRVVRASGDIGGYRWGIDRKKMLLQQEAIQ